ncbi:hypothetical protein PAXRUDRAFT_821158 [Paxillus rubicundulus Ve08.2h10]|uniref:DUF1776-domain-containing protein n=1 Tax=Paxillus rubicundulus Ve08.2h10 TaxID=930991 RepID=A0A0D0DYR0_9AGAM|nr:hypothetical protein PAXRUDRAFT_821158 [Paxillus rubicundulus Ve08.2h10]
MVPTIDELEQYFESVEHFVSGSLAAVSPDLPNVREAVNRLWVDISRFGPPSFPSLPDIHVPGLGAFEIPPPPLPPPPPPPKSFINKIEDWIIQHPWITSGMVISALGAGLLAGYSTVHTRSVHRRRIKTAAVQPEKRQVVVVLGGDHPLGLPLIMELEKQGYIVITSVSSPEAVSDIENKGHGYVCALILDPNGPGTIPIFLRSLASTLSRRFPITAAGDPYATTPYHPLVYSVISLLTMPTTSIHCAPAPLEQISLRSTYLPHLLSTHIAPLQTLQALLPLLRADAQRTRGRKSIIICLPAADARVGLPFCGVSAMSAAATLRAADVLRREVATAQGMSTIRIVTVDVGAVGPSHDDFGVANTTVDWTPSEKASYGAAFSAFGETRGSRTPEDVSVFVDSLIGVVSAGTKTRGAGNVVLGIDLGLVSEKIKDWMRGDRFSVGGGAYTYTIASFLPPVLLDSLLVLPHTLMDIRNRYLPISPTQPRHVPVPPVLPPVSAPPTETAALAVTSPLVLHQSLDRIPTDPKPPPATASHSDLVDEHESGSDADVEEKEEDLESSVVGNSWISLGPHE